MEDRVEKITINYNLIDGKSSHGGHCTFCGRSKQVSDYEAGRYVVQFCDSCAKNPPGTVKVEVVKVVEEKPESKYKKKQFGR